MTNAAPVAIGWKTVAVSHTSASAWAAACQTCLQPASKDKSFTAIHSQLRLGAAVCSACVLAVTASLHHTSVYIHTCGSKLGINDLQQCSGCCAPAHISIALFQHCSARLHKSRHENPRIMSCCAYLVCSYCPECSRWQRQGGYQQDHGAADPLWRAAAIHLAPAGVSAAQGEDLPFNGSSKPSTDGSRALDCCCSSAAQEQ